MVLTPHVFLLSPSHWIGEGKITFSAASDVLKFYTRWIIAPPSGEGKQLTEVLSTQDVEMQGGEDQIKNRFILSNVTPHTFDIQLENELVGIIQGKGIIDLKKIAWEFRGYPTFEGFEVYELQDNGDYLFHAEYVSPDQFRSTIDGRIWQKSIPV